MQILTPLITGFPDAGDGSAAIYRRGTSTPATCYSDFNGTLPTTDHPLDSNGRVARWINEIVDVSIFDADGTAVITFTYGHGAPALEVRHTHWTGVDYDTGASALGKPLTFQTLLDKLYASHGAADGDVLFSGSAMALQDALAQLILGGIYSVRSATYGASGDGVADDTAEIQGAIAAAAGVGGGVVYLPPGNYRITSALDLSVANGAKVNIIGAGPSMTTLSMDHASNSWINVSNSGPANGLQIIAGITFAALQTCSGSNVVDTVGNWTRGALLDCQFGGSTAGLLKLAAGNEAAIERCRFVLDGGNNNQAINVVATTGTGPLRVRGCTFVGPATAYNPTNAVVYANAITLEKCFFSFAGTTGTGTMIDTRAKGYSSVHNCRFVPGAATWTCINPGAFTGGAGDNGGNQSLFLESGNIFQDLNVGLDYAPFTGWGNSGGHYQLLSRMARHRELTSTTTETINLDMRAAGSAIVNCIGGGSTVTFSVADTAHGDAPMGSLFYLLVKNASGGAVTVAFSNAVITFKKVVVSPSNGNHVGYIFYRSASGVWTQVGASVDAV